MSLNTKIVVSLIGIVLVTHASAFARDTLGTKPVIHPDVKGSPLMPTDSAGVALWRDDKSRQLEAIWSDINVRRKNESGANTGTIANKLWYIGKPQDSATGLVYFGASGRICQLSPAVGRFVGFDPTGADEDNPHSFNRYACGKNNPYKYLDPDGRTPVHVAVAIHVGGGSSVGWLSGGAVNAMGQLIMNGSVQWGGVNGVFDAASEGAVIGMVLGPNSAGLGAGMRSTAGVEARAAASNAAKTDVATSTSAAINPASPSSSYVNGSGARSVPNRSTDVTRAELEANLSASGFSRSVSKDGKVVNYSKDGKNYAVRDNADSTKGPTADYSSSGTERVNLKIRLDSAEGARVP